MKKIALLFIILMLGIISCSDNRESVKLEPGTPEYLLAEELAKKIIFLNPDDNNIIVEADDFVITTGEVIALLYTRLGNNQGRLTNQSEEQLRQIIVSNAERLAEQKLLETAATNAGYSVTTEEVDSTLASRYKKFGGVDFYREQMEAAGIDFNVYLEGMKTGLLIRKYLDKEIGNPKDISEEEISKRFEEKYTGDQKASAQHILLNTQGKSAEEKQNIRKKMEGILSEARSGKDFGELAQKYSEDPGSKDRGGLYEDFERGDMVKPFEDAAFTTPIGEISDIVETQYGFHIIKVVDRKKGDQDVDNVRTKIVEELQREKIESYIKNMREDAGVKVLSIE
jgi:parvulin-like peptidyl-prolyl isomerase